MPTRTITYVTSSQYKEEESRIIHDSCQLSNGTPVRDIFEFKIRKVPIKEALETSLSIMVQMEVTNAYSQIKVPCMVEHAGLVFQDYVPQEYPGGLTKPMWNVLGSAFVEETRSAGRRVLARAVVAYCDGLTVRTFVGETDGTLAANPRGGREFYWDTVFIPNQPDGSPGALTYSEIVADPSLGLEYKVKTYSQSRKAIIACCDYLAKNPANALWPH